MSVFDDAQMKTLHVITGLENGGAEFQLKQLCIYNKAESQVVFSLRDAGFYGPDFIEQGIKLVEGEMPKGRLTVGGIVQLYKLIRSYKPDTIQTLSLIHI